MIKLIFAVVLSFGVSLSVYAGTPTGQVANQKECSQKIQGGIDLFPWSVALPFPWNNIQGVWMIKDGKTPVYLRAKVVRSTTNRRILSLSVVTEGACGTPIASGVGYIDALEKNVVRAIMNDGQVRYQMKLAMFNVKDLGVDVFACGETIMAASLQEIGSMPSLSGIPVSGWTTPYVDGVENIMLKKFSPDINSVCKKSGSK